MTSIGIDIGASELVVAIRHKNMAQEVRKFDNTASGHSRIIKLGLKFLRYGKVKVAMDRAISPGNK